MVSDPARQALRALVEKWRDRATHRSARYHERRAWLTSAADLETMLSAPASQHPSAQAISLDAAMRALESIQAQGYFLYDANGNALTERDAYLKVITTALDAALIAAAPVSSADQTA